VRIEQPASRAISLIVIKSLSCLCHRWHNFIVAKPEAAVKNEGPPWPTARPARAAH